MEVFHIISDIHIKEKRLVFRMEELVIPVKKKEATEIDLELYTKLEAGIQDVLKGRVRRVK